MPAPANSSTLGQIGDSALAVRHARGMGAIMDGVTRAAVLLPGWGIVKKNEMRDKVAASLAQLGATDLEDGEIAGESYNRVKMGGKFIDIYEAHWADLAPPDEPTQSPLMRLIASSGLIWYWLCSKWYWGHIHKSAVARALGLPGFFLLGWWILGLVPIAYGFALLAPATSDRAPAAGSVDGAVPPQDIRRTDELDAQAVAGLLPASAWTGIKWVGGWATSPVYLFAILVMSFLPVINLVAVANFTRRYLDGGNGFDIAIIGRALSTLGRVYAARAAADETRLLYDEVVLVGHSMGAIIAVQALATPRQNDIVSPENLERTVLVTWGSPIFTLGLRKPSVMADVKAVLDRVPLWIDVHSAQDKLSLPLEEQINRYGQDNSRQIGLPQLALHKAHGQYYCAKEALAPLYEDRTIPPKPIRATGAE